MSISSVISNVRQSIVLFMKALALIQEDVALVRVVYLASNRRVRERR
jgi:hypothetical protein